MKCWRGVCLLLGVLSFAVRTAGEVAARPALSPTQIRVLEGIGRSHSAGQWTDLTSNQLVELRIRAELTDDAIRKSHLPGGLIASVRYADAGRAEAVAYENLDLSGAYTGFYLASSAFRYAVYREPAVLSNIRAALDGIELLLRCSGRPGYLPRFAGLSSDPAYKQYYSHWGGEDPSRPGFGRLAYPGGPNAGAYVWLGGPSREVYSGVNMGLATIFQIVREPKIRERLTNIVDQMVTRLVADHWQLDDGQGNVTFMPPLLAAAITRTAASLNPKKYSPLYQSRLNDLMSAHGGEPQIQPGLGLYGNYQESVFLLANLMVLSRLEPETSSGRLFFQERLTQIYRRSSFQLNPWLAASYASVFEHAPNDTSSRAVLQGMLYEFPIPRWVTAGVRGTNDAMETIVANGETWSRVPLQLEQRQVQAFQWAQTPVYLPPGADALVVHPGVDFMLPFWIARDANLIPDAESLTAAPAKERSRSPSTNSFRGRLSATNAPATNTPAAKR